MLRDSDGRVVERMFTGYEASDPQAEFLGLTVPDEKVQWDEARQGVTKVAAAISSLVEQVDRATAGLTRVVQ